MKMKMIVAKKVWFYNGCRINDREVFYMNGEKLVNSDFEAVEKLCGEIMSEEEITREQIAEMIDEYAWAIDNWDQQKKAERKNDNIRKFLG